MKHQKSIFSSRTDEMEGAGPFLVADPAVLAVPAVGFPIRQGGVHVAKQQAHSSKSKLSHSITASYSGIVYAISLTRYLWDLHPAVLSHSLTFVKIVRMPETSG
jgi:hypothetical protein